MIMEIERQWGKWPGWFGELGRDEQVRLLAWYRVTHSPRQGPSAPRQRGR